MFVVVDVPLGRSTNDVAGVRLTGTAHEATAAGSLGGVVTQTAGANTAGVDTVFGDTTTVDGNIARDGIHFDEDDYTILAASITAAKTSRVISDPLNGTTNPKLIPGAVVEYCITAANATGSATATNVSISDTLPSERPICRASSAGERHLHERHLQCRWRDRRRSRVRCGQRHDPQRGGGRYPHRAVPRHDQLSGMGERAMPASGFGTLKTDLARLFGLVMLAFLSALLVAAPAGATVPFAAPRTITNIATIGWDAGSQRVERPSNRVDILVSAPSAVSLQTLRLNGDSYPPSVLSATCVAPGQPPASQPAAGSDTPPLAALDMVQTGELHAGRPLVLALERPSHNRDAQTVETMRIFVRTNYGDVEELLLVETSADSGRFVGIMLTTTAAPLSGDCRLSVHGEQTLTLTLSDERNGASFVDAEVDILVDPFGIAFDSRDGTPIAGVRITLVDARTGQPAQVFGDDGLSSYPSTVVTGESVTDSGGVRYDYPPGDYRFPLVRPGTYRLVVQPPSPYTAPSQATPADLAPLRRPDGPPFTITAGSYGQEIVLAGSAAVRIDIPLDRPATPIVIGKTASRAEAEAGDLVHYRVTIRNPDAGATGALTITDRIPVQMRFRTGSARLDGIAIADPVSAASRTLTFTLPSLAPNAQALLSYVLEVRPDARRGDAVNRVQAQAALGNLSNVADAVVRIRREAIADRMIITGRIVDGACGVDPRTRPGIAGVRVMLEDGSYSVTDRDGLYHFEGVMPGTPSSHIDDATCRRPRGGGWFAQRPARRRAFSRSSRARRDDGARRFPRDRDRAARRGGPPTVERPAPPPTAPPPAPSATG